MAFTFVKCWGKSFSKGKAKQEKAMRQCPVWPSLRYSCLNKFADIFPGALCFPVLSTATDIKAPCPGSLGSAERSRDKRTDALQSPEEPRSL